MPDFRQLVIEVHRRSLWQVLAIYAVASWVIYEVVLALYEGLGLPDWVPGTAVVLLLIGLPIVLATAFVHEGPPGSAEATRSGGSPGLEGLETTADTLQGPRPGERPPAEGTGSRTGHGPSPAASPRGVGRLFTWSRAITGGVLAFAALGMAVTGFMGMRALGIGPAATLLSKGVLEERDPVVLADFESLTGDDVLARVVTEAFRAALAQSSSIRLAGGNEVAYVLERMQRPEGGALTPALAREVATRGGMKAVVEGDVGTLGGRYVLSARVVNPLDGAALVTESETAADSTELVAAIGRLAQSLREEIGESLKSIRRSPYLTSITTPSLPALRKLIQAWDADNRGYPDRALQLLDDAIALDPEFSEAHRKRGVILTNDGRIGEALPSLEKALEHPDRLTEYELHHTRAIYASNTGDPRRAISEYSILLEADSTDGRALNNLGVIYLELQEWAKAEHAFRRAARVEERLEPGETVFAPTFWQLAASRWTLGHDDSAAAALRAVESIDPDNPVIPGAWALLHAAAGQYAESEEAARRLLRDYSATSWRSFAHSVLARLAATQGRLEEATAHLGQARQADLARGNRPGAFVEAVYPVLLRAGVAGDTSGALALLDGVRDGYDLSAEPDPKYLDLVVAYATVGAVDSARAVLERLRAQPEWWLATQPGQLEAAEAAVAMAEGRWSVAAERWRAAIRAVPVRCPTCFHTQLATALEVQGEVDGAIEAYTTFVEARNAFRFYPAYPDDDGLYRAFALERLGILHAERGERDRAADYYARFIDLWKDADPQLQPRVDAARRALTRLTREG